MFEGGQCFPLAENAELLKSKSAENTKFLLKSKSAENTKFDQKHNKLNYPANLCYHRHLVLLTYVSISLEL